MTSTHHCESATVTILISSAVFYSIPTNQTAKETQIQINGKGHIEKYLDRLLHTFLFKDFRSHLADRYVKYCQKLC